MRFTESLKYNRDFKWLYNRGASIAAGYVVIYYRKTPNAKDGAKNRLGITVSKKLGNAVKRNRVRRLIKESYRLMEGNMSPGYSIVLVARMRAADCTFEQIKRDVSFLFKKSGIIKSAAANSAAASLAAEKKPD